MHRNIVFINNTVKHSVKRRTMKKWTKRFLKYIRNPLNEFEFVVLTIHKKRSRLPANICVDDNGFWINLGSKKIILFQTNNDERIDFNKMLPMSIENETQILVKNESIDLTDIKIKEIKEFVIKCQDQILQISNGKISICEFLEILKDKGFYNFLLT
jgi:hypothetical protein